MIEIVIYTFFFFKIGDFPMQFSIRQAEAYTTYFELGEPVIRSLACVAGVSKKLREGNETAREGVRKIRSRGRG